MPQQTPNLDLTLFDDIDDKPESFLAYRIALAGTQAGSNMLKIDEAVQLNSNDIVEIKGVGWTDESIVNNALEITGLKQSDVYTVAMTGANTLSGAIGEITTIPNDMIVKIIPSAKNTTTVTVSINSETALPLVKVRNISGSTVYAPLEEGDLQPNMPVFITKSPTGNRYIAVGFGEQYARNVFYDNGDGTFESVQSKIDNMYLQDTTPFTTQSSIESLPLASVEGKVSNFEEDGLTLVNSVENGDFSDGTTGWSGSGGSISVIENVLLSTGSGASLQCTVTGQYNSISENSLIFKSAKIRVTNSECTSLRMRLFDGSVVIGNISIPNPELNKWYNVEISNIIDVGLSTQIRVEFLHIYTDAATANGKVMEVDGNAGVFTIDMTALGIESYTEAQMLDLVRNGYFDGITNVENPVVESVGKNLFDENTTIVNATRIKTQFVDGKVLFDNSSNTAARAEARHRLILEEGKTYKLTKLNEVITSGSTIVITSITEIDSALTLQAIGFTQFTFNNPTGLYDVVLVSNTGLQNVSLNILLEEVKGQTLEIYKPYKSSKLTANVPLRSLPNVVKDRIYESNGQILEEKNVEEYVLQSADITTLTTTPTNVDYITIPSSKLNDVIAFVTPIQGVTIVGGFEGEVNGSLATVDLVTSIGNHATFAGSLIIIVAKGTYASLAEAQTDLAGTVIQYQLATPEIINLTEQGLTSGELFSFENGTVYNTSDTFHGNVSFDVATNRGAQIESLLDSANAQAKAIATKADKVQADWIEPTLINGWVEVNDVRFTKDEFGLVLIRGQIQSGTSGTVAFILPEGYRPIDSIIFTTASGGPLEASNKVTVSTSGEVFVTFFEALPYLSGVIFRAEGV